MTESDRVKRLYDGKRVTGYNRRISHFNTTKKRSINRSKLKSGDEVIVFCCGTGLDFSYVQKKIGPTGRITGLDFSANMLDEARRLVDRKGWLNVELVELDILQMDSRYESSFDVAICTLGLSIIPDYELAYRIICSSVREGGQIIIGDMKLARGFKAIFNPLTVALAKGFGGTSAGHENILKLRDLMRQELKNTVEEELMLGSYLYIIGEK